MNASTPRPGRLLGRYFGGLFLLLCLALLATAAQAQDDPPGRVGRLAQTYGVVRTFEGDQGWLDALRNQPLSTGDRVATDRDGRAVIQIGSSTVRLGPDTLLVVARLDDDRVRLRLDHGVMTLRVRAPEVVGEFSIESPDGFFVPREPGFWQVSIEAGHSLAMAWAGAVEFQGRDATGLDVPSGQRGEFWREGAGQVTHYRWVAPPGDALAQSMQTDDARDEAAATRVAAYVPPEMTGAAELDRYGRWDSSPEFGTVWIPTTIAVGWAPYQAGHWAWVPPWGWTWVDDAPWGFAPFHYGRWCQWHGRWAWVPGVYVARPAYAPALVGWIGGANFSVAVTVGRPAPMIGWVPLAPAEPFYPAYAVSPGYWHRVNHSIGYPEQRPLPGQPHPGNVAPRIVPTGPIAYANRHIAGAVTVLPTPTPIARQPVGAGRSVDYAKLMKQFDSGKAAALPPPPPPAGRGELSRGAPVVEVSGPLKRVAEPPAGRMTIPERSQGRNVPVPPAQQQRDRGEAVAPVPPVGQPMPPQGRPIPPGPQPPRAAPQNPQTVQTPQTPQAVSPPQTPPPPTRPPQTPPAQAPAAQQPPVIVHGRQPPSPSPVPPMSQVPPAAQPAPVQPQPQPQPQPAPVQTAPAARPQPPVHSPQPVAVNPPRPQGQPQAEPAGRVPPQPQPQREPAREPNRGDARDANRGDPRSHD